MERLLEVIVKKGGAFLVGIGEEDGVGGEVVDLRVGGMPGIRARLHYSTARIMSIGGIRQTTIRRLLRTTQQPTSPAPLAALPDLGMQ